MIRRFLRWAGFLAPPRLSEHDEDAASARLYPPRKVSAQKSGGKETAAKGGGESK